ncbi:MAG: hypothetical protein QME05_00500 [Candidatus Margulisbacteria bacterium]|nr:hypothetical protein [Candidatus Margulisiibacteriota bacterium]
MAEKNRVEVLLEEIRSDVKAIAEGHSVLNNKIDNLEITLTNKINDVVLAVKMNSKDIKELKVAVQQHVRMPAPLAHAAV